MILAVYCDSAQVWFTADKTEIDIQYDKLCIWVISRVTKHKNIRATLGSWEITKWK